MDANITLLNNKIHLIRNTHVMLDSDLAELYNTTAKALNQAVKRNMDRFPEDFMFRLTQKEFSDLRSQTVTSSLHDHGGKRYAPFAFTEHGILMLSSVLRSKIATKVNIQIMRAFVSIRKSTANYSLVHDRITSLQNKYNGQFRVIFDAIRKIGFNTTI